MSFLDQYCRLCLGKENVVAHLYGEEKDGSGFPLYKKVIHCLSIKLQFGDGLPTLLCQACADRVKDFWCFQKKCERIDMSLCRLLKQHKNKLADNWEDEIKLISQAALASSTSKKGIRRQKLQDLPFSDQEGVEAKTANVTGQTHVKVEAVIQDNEDEDWPHLPSSPLSAASPQSSKEGDEKNEDLGGKTAKKKERKRSEYTCEFCGRSFPRSNHLTQHELTHTAEKPFQCSECNKSFWYKASLIGHIKQTHTGDVNYTCELCGKGFFKKTELTRHKPTHSNETPHKCPQCGMGFKITKTLKRHIRNVHTAQRSHTCHTCGKSFTQLQTLKVHLVLHSGVKPYVCSYCGKGFSQSAPLKTHVRIHTGERPYICHSCGDSFSTRSALTSHAFKHSGSLPYACTRCSSTFRLKRDLIQHEQGHDDEESKMGRSSLMRLEAERLVSKDHPQLHDPVPDDDGHGGSSKPAESSISVPLLSNVSHPIPASHTVGKPNPPTIYHGKQQLPVVSSSPCSGPVQIFSHDLSQAPSPIHMVSHTVALSHSGQNINPHLESGSEETHSTNLQLHLHPPMHPSNHLNNMFQNQL